MEPPDHMTLEETDFNHEQIQEELVAYLDGELDEAETARVESRLASDAEYRQRLQVLQRTWDLLDHLPHTELSDEFTKSTVEVIASKAADEVAEVRRSSNWSRGILLAAAAAVMLLAGGAAYAITQSFLSAPNSQLVKDYDVIENIDVLRNIDSFEFLKNLRDDVFATKIERDSKELSPMSTEDRIAVVSGLSPDKRDEVNRKRKRFESLDAEQQVRLRELYHKIETAEDAGRLHAVTLRYHAWLQTLSATERAKLLDLDPTKKLDRIQELQRQQMSEFTRSYVNIPLPTGDITRIREWIQRFLDRHQEEIIAAIPEEERKKIDALPDDRLKKFALRNQLASLDLKFFRNLASAEELDDLFGRSLSPEAEEVLQNQTNPLKPNELLARWLKEGISLPDFQQIDDSELNKFFYEVLDEDERTLLDEMSVGNRSRWLARSYSIYRFTGQKRPLSELMKWGDPRSRTGSMRGGPGRGGPGRGQGGGPGGGSRGLGGRGPGGGPGGGSNGGGPGGFSRPFNPDGSGASPNGFRNGRSSGGNEQRPQRPNPESPDSQKDRSADRSEDAQGEPSASSDNANGSVPKDVEPKDATASD